MGAIYTIGYGNRTIEAFADLLRRYQVEFLIDIRSKPYSKVHPDFSKRTLEILIQQAGFRYVYMGDTLGGMPDDTELLDDSGHVDYAKITEKPSFVQGIARLQKAHEQPAAVALMCAELRPEGCHRSRLVGRRLGELGIPVLHIVETGELKPQAQVEVETQKPEDIQLGLFDSSE